MESKQVYEQRLAAKLTVLDAELGHLERVVTMDFPDECRESLARIRDKSFRLHARLERIRASRDERWIEMRSDAERAYWDLGRDLKDTCAEFF